MLQGSSRVFQLTLPEPKGNGEASGEMVRRVDRKLDFLGAVRLRANEAEAVSAPQRNLGFFRRRGRGKQDGEDERKEEEVHEERKG